MPKKKPAEPTPVTPIPAPAPAPKAPEAPHGSKKSEEKPPENAGPVPEQSHFRFQARRGKLILGPKALEILRLVMSSPAPGDVPLISHVCLMTPQIASRILEIANEEAKINREIRQKRVAAIAEFITTGRFVPTHQGVAVDELGRLMDGQHRLQAIVDTQTPQVMMLCFLPFEVWCMIDTGMNKNAQQFLEQMWKGKTRYAVLASIANVHLELRYALLTSRRCTRLKTFPPFLQVEEAMMLKNTIEWAMTFYTGNRREKPGIGLAPILAALSYAFPVNTACVHEFAQRVAAYWENPVNGEYPNATSTDPVAACWHQVCVAERMNTDKGHYFHRPASEFKRTLTCLYAFIHNEQVLLEKSGGMRETDEAALWFRDQREKMGLDIDLGPVPAKETKTKTKTKKG